jgi:hypothetical protein
VNGSGGHELLSTYFSKTRAEARAREEIQTRYVSGCRLEDRTAVDIKIRLEDNAFTGQSLEFSSGRKIEVVIEKELIEGQALIDRQRKIGRQKLEYLPQKVYIITEKVTELDIQQEEPLLDETDSSSDTKCTTLPSVHRAAGLERMLCAQAGRQCIGQQAYAAAPDRPPVPRGEIQPQRHGRHGHQCETPLACSRRGGAAI